MSLSRTTANMLTAPTSIFRTALFVAHPLKTRRTQVNNSRCSTCWTAALCLFCNFVTITAECSHTGLVPESPTFFNSSPFKVLSPQPPKFLKSLLPVKEENKVKKALEAQPLLGQEVRKLSSLSRGRYLCLCFYHVISFLIRLFPQSHEHFHFCHSSYQITFSQHGNNINSDKYTNCLKLPGELCNNGFAVL